MYKLHASHLEFLTLNLAWANKEAERFFALGMVVWLEPWPPVR